MSSVLTRRRTVLVKHDWLLSRREKLACNEMRGFFIEDEDRGVVEESPLNRHTLSLPT